MNARRDTADNVTLLDDGRARTGALLDLRPSYATACLVKSATLLIVKSQCSTK